MGNTEEETDIDIDDIGAILKSSRLKSKKSLEEISSELCIRKIYLTALEEGDYDTLPAIPYGVGYIRTYAQYLGLSPERAVKLYKAAATEDEPNKIAEPTSEPEVNKSNKWHIVAGIVALVVVYGVWSLAAQRSTSKMEIATGAPEAIEENIASEDENIIPDTEKKQASEEGKENEIVEKNFQLNMNSMKITGESNLPAKEETATADNTIKFSFIGECWIRLQDKKKVYIDRVYHKGDVKEVPYTEDLFLSVGLPKNVKITVKGVEKNLQGTIHKKNIPLDSLN